MEVGPARKNNSNPGIRREFYTPPSVRLVLQQGRTGAAAHRGRAGGLAVAELELELVNEATHA